MIFCFLPTIPTAELGPAKQKSKKVKTARKKLKQKVNKNVKKLARKSALSIKVKSKNLTVIEDFDFDTPKTKSILKVLEALGISSKKSLFVLDNSKKNVFLSARNLKNINVLSNDDLNTYNIMNAQHLIVSEVALETIEKNLLK